MYALIRTCTHVPARILGPLYTQLCPCCGKNRYRSFSLCKFAHARSSFLPLADRVPTCPLCASTFPQRGFRRIPLLLPTVCTRIDLLGYRTLEFSFLPPCTPASVENLCSVPHSRFRSIYYYPSNSHDSPTRLNPVPRVSIDPRQETILAIIKREIQPTASSRSAPGRLGGKT